MKFGSHEVCDVVFRATATQKMGSKTFYKNEPMLYFDTLKTTTLDGSASTVYATGGKGNAQLIGWDGDKTLAFSMQDALLSPEGIAILAGADLIDATAEKPIYQHMTGTYKVNEEGKVVVETAGVVWSKATDDNKVDNADIYVMILDDYNQIDGEPMVPTAVEIAADKATITVGTCLTEGMYVFVDYYVARKSAAQQIEITPDKFGGYFYIEGSTLYRRESDGVDLPAELVIPKGKVQSNFSISMSSSGDPSTFDFNIDAFPDYLKFDRTKKLLAAIQIIDEAAADEDNAERKAGCPTAGE